jgi:hypothetical protein
VEAVSISSEEEAKKYYCDFVLNTELIKIKQGSKIGGILNAVKNTDPGASTSFTIEATLILIKTADGLIKSQQSVNGKFNGKADIAAMRALDKGCEKIVGEFRQVQ